MAWVESKKHSFILVALSLMVSSAVSQVLAADQPASSDMLQADGPTVPAAGTTTDANSSTISSVSLSGGVHKVELSLEKLRDVGLDLKHLNSAASHLYDEVTIQPVTIQTEPEVVGMGTIIYIPIGTTPVGPPAPPRKDRLDLAMGQLIPQITLMKNNADDFVSGKDQLDLPDDLIAELKPLTDGWIATVNNVYGQLVKLEPLVQGPKYDNAAIAARAVEIQKDVKQLDELRTKISKVIRKHGKAISKK